MSEMPYLGEIRLFAGTRVPRDWLPCEGQLLPISGNEQLFVLLGTTYGGDGQANFGLPDLRGRVPLHRGAAPRRPNYELGEKHGTETERLGVEHLPAHSHPLVASDLPATLPDPAGAVLARPSSTQPGTSMYGADSLAAMHPAAIAAAGQGQAHENMQPFLAATYIIAPFGAYPV